MDDINMINNSDNTTPVNKQENSSPIVKASTQKEEKKFKKKVKKSTFKTVLAVLIILLGFSSVYLLMHAIDVGAKAVNDAFAQTYQFEKDATYEKIKDYYFAKTEAEYHTSNRGTISIGQIREVGYLEVLTVSDVEYIIENRNDNDGKVDVWLEVPGSGTFRVDLQAAEFVVDNERSHVFARIPYPELTNIQIDYANTKKLLFEDGPFFNGNYKEGEDLARRQSAEAYDLITTELYSNQNYFQNAKDAAVSSITYLIKQYNPDEPDLTVDVVFY